MKKSIHPKVQPIIFLDTSCNKEFVALSTLEPEATREVKGVTYGVQSIEISSASHPFYTGKQMLLDTARRAEKFQERASKRTAVAAERKGKKAKRAKVQEKRQAKAKKAASSKKEDTKAE
jgi:large subunit ribosomal protein L31